MKVGYVRVSTLDQNPARQMELMKSLGVEKIFLDKISGKDTNRPQFNEMLSFLREGDTLYIESFSRLSRSTKRPPVYGCFADGTRCESCLRQGKSRYHHTTGAVYADGFRRPLGAGTRKYPRKTA